MRIKQFFKAHNLVTELDVIHAHVCYPSAYLANSIATVLNVRTIIQHHGIDALQLLNGRLSFITKIQKKLSPSERILFGKKFLSIKIYYRQK